MKMNMHRAADRATGNASHIHMPMLQTAEVVAQRYNISRDAMMNMACSHRSGQRQLMRPAAMQTN